MGVSAADRQNRLLDLLAVIEDHPGVSSREVGKVAQRSWFVTPRTAQDYIDNLVNFGWVTNTNTALHATARGRAALLGISAALEPPEPSTAAPANAEAPATTQAPPPSPPTSQEGGGGDTNAQHSEIANE